MNTAFLLLQLGFDEVRADFALYRVEDGKEALDFLRRQGRYVDAPKRNVVLLNLNMPRVSDLEVLAAIHANRDMSDIPAVVFSSSRLDKDKARCLALGARAFVTKPAALEEFLHVLRDVCSLFDQRGRAGTTYPLCNLQISDNRPCIHPALMATISASSSCLMIWMLLSPSWM